MANVMEKIIERVTGEGEREEEKHKMQECECTAAGLRLNNRMRELWDDHVFFTREVIMAASLGEPNHPIVQPSIDRLLQNQDQIGAAVALFYGKEAGDELTRLLREHINQAVQIVVAAKTGQTETQKAVTEAWYRNAKEISRLLSQANPKYWPYDAVLTMMNQHLDFTTKEAVDMLTGNYAQAQEDFTAVRNEIMMMADALTDGILMQFPEKFMT